MRIMNNIDPILTFLFQISEETIFLGVYTIILIFSSLRLMNSVKQGDFSLLGDLKRSIYATFSFFWLRVMLYSVIFEDNFIIKGSELLLIINTLVSVLGFIFTVHTIIYAFEEEFKKNKLIELSDSKFYDVYTRQTDSLNAMALSLSVFLIMYFLGFYNFSVALFSSIYTFLVMLLLVFSAIRTFRCFYLFKLLQDRINKSKEGRTS